MEFHFTPSRTPLPIKALIFTTLFFSICSPLAGTFLGLSIRGIQHWYLWQLASYLFIHPFPSELISLIFYLYLIWTFGTSLIEQIKPKYFFILYFGSGLAAALFALLPMFLLSSKSPLIGCLPAIYAILTSWTLLNADTSILLFLTIPMRARNLISILIGFTLLISLSHANWIPFCASIGAITFSYFFTLIVCKIHSPFPFLLSMENRLFDTINRLENAKLHKHRPAKIYDIQSGEPILNDDQFVDSMLAKISLYGEKILSQEEKQRMQTISRKKNANHTNDHRK